MFSIRRTLLLTVSRGLQRSSRSLQRLASRLEGLAEPRADEVVEEAVERHVVASDEGAFEQVGGPPAHWLKRVQAADAQVHWLEYVPDGGRRRLAQPGGDVKADEADDERVAPMPVAPLLAEDMPVESPQAVEAQSHGGQADHQAAASRLLPPTAPERSVTRAITKQESVWQKPQDVVSEGKVKADKSLKDGADELQQAVEAPERLSTEPISIESGKAEPESVSAPAARRAIARSEATGDKPQELPSERRVKADELVIESHSAAEAGDPSAESTEVAQAARPITRQDEKGGRIRAMRFRPRPQTRLKYEQREVESRPTEVDMLAGSQPSASLMGNEQVASQTPSEQMPAERMAFADAEQLVSVTEGGDFKRNEADALKREANEGQSSTDQAHVEPKRAKQAEQAPLLLEERSSRATAKPAPWPDFEWGDSSASLSWSAEEIAERWPALPREEEQHVRLAERTQMAEEWEMTWRTWQRRKRLDLEQRGHLWNESLF